MHRTPPVLLILGTLGVLAPAFCPAQTVVVERPEFRALVPEDAVVEKLVSGFGFIEGPAWNPVEKFLVFSDIPHNCIYKYNAATKSVSDFRRPTPSSNGNTYDAAGDFFSCEQNPHRVSVMHPDGTMEYLPDNSDGKMFSSPNDVVVKRDGTVWFSDPSYGLGRRHKDQATNNVFCYDPKTRQARIAAADFDQPNGLCFSPDEKKLYVADSGAPRNVRVYDVSADNQLSSGAVFCRIDKGVPDGMRCDAAGNLWSTAGDGVQVFNPAGERLGKILVPETPANLCFGAVDEQGRTDLYLTAHTSLYRVKVTAAGAASAKLPGS